MSRSLGACIFAISQSLFISSSLIFFFFLTIVFVVCVIIVSSERAPTSLQCNSSKVRNKQRKLVTERKAPSTHKSSVTATI